MPHTDHSNKKPQKEQRQTRSQKTIDESSDSSLMSVQRMIAFGQTNNLNSHQIIQLQREHGNQFVLQLMGKNKIQRGVTDLLSQFESGSVSNSTGSNLNDKGITGSNVSNLVTDHEQSIDDSAPKTETKQVPVPGVRTETNRNLRLHGHEVATRQHDVDRNALTTWLQEARVQTTDRRLKNSAEWILKGNTRFYAITMTGDSDMRITEAGMNPKTDAAYFPEGTGGPGHVLDSPVDYNWQDLTDNTNVELDEDGKVTEGWNDTGYIAITNPLQKGKDAVWETIRHEVQHDTDRSADKIAAAGTRMESRMEKYKTEYRAYNYEGGRFEQYNGDPNRNWLGYNWTEKQAQIFFSIWSGYSHTRKAWDPTDPNPMSANIPRDKNDVHDPALWGPNTVAQVEAYRQQILNYVNPDDEGFNKYNSVRVDTYYEALSAAPDGHNTRYRANRLDAAPNHVQDILSAIRKLKSEDADYILNEAPDYAKLLRSKYGSGTTRAAIRAQIQNQI